MAIIIMTVILAVSRGQHIAIFRMGYELSHLHQTKDKLEIELERQVLQEEELRSPAALKRQAERLELDLAGEIRWEKTPGRQVAQP